MFDFGPCVLKYGTELDFETDILIFLVFNKLAAFIGEFHNHMDGAVTELNAVMFALFSFVNNFTDFKGILQQLKNAFYIGLKQSQNTASENIRDIFKMMIFIL